MTTSEPWRTTGHVDSSAHTQDVHTKREGGSALRDKALWVTGLVSKVNAYSILTSLYPFFAYDAIRSMAGRIPTSSFLFLSPTFTLLSV